MNKKLTYKNAGVDITAGNSAVSRMKKFVEKTFNKNVLIGFGKFGGAFSLKNVCKMKEPVLIASIDGVGTKIKVAKATGKLDSIGKDLVNHCVNDILCQGAKPLFFLDYIAADVLKPDEIEQIVKGISEACVENDIALIGGETAEMPGVYEKGEHDLAGCIVGVVEKKKVVDGSKIKAGDKIVGLKSNGLHTNGYSLARKVLFEVAGFKVNDFVEELGTTVGEALMKTHISYLKPVSKLLKKVEVKGIAHITGGGIEGNLSRIIPKGLGIKIERIRISIPKIFQLIQREGNVPEEDMWRTFNMGIGLALVVSEKDSEKVLKELKKLKFEGQLIGDIV